MAAYVHRFPSTPSDAKSTVVPQKGSPAAEKMLDMLVGRFSATFTPELLNTFSSPKLRMSVGNALVTRTYRTPRPAAEGRASASSSRTAASSILCVERELVSFRAANARVLTLRRGKVSEGLEGEGSRVTHTSSPPCPLS